MIALQSMQDQPRVTDKKTEAPRGEGSSRGFGRELATDGLGANCEDSAAESLASEAATSPHPHFLLLSARDTCPFHQMTSPRQDSLEAGGSGGHLRREAVPCSLIDCKLLRSF